MGARKRLRRRIVPAATVVAAVLAVRFLFFEVYRVETASMEPFLYGSPVEGDRVLVLRRPGVARALRRFDPVVFRTPDGAHAIKRAIGLPGETVQVAEGEILLNGSPYRKTVEEAEAMLVPVFDSARDAWDDLWKGKDEIWRRQEDRSIVVDAPAGSAEPARLLTRRSILDEYPDRRGSLVPGRVVVEDLALRVDWEPLGEGGTLALSLHASADRFEFYLHRDVGSTLATIRRASFSGEGEEIARATLPPLAPGRVVAVEASDVDGRLRWRVDGRDALAPVDVGRASFSATNGAGAPRSSGATISANGLRARLHRVRLRRDVHYVAEGEFAVGRALVLGPDEVFLLGDNSGASLDGREWGPIRTSRLVGVPFLLYWPPARFRFP